MAKIQPFRGFLPAAELAEKVAVYIESMSIEEAREERSHNPYSFLHMLVPEKEEGESKEETYKKISANFTKFGEDRVFNQSEQPCLYIIRIGSGEATFTGIWTCTDSQDYLNGTLQKHESVKADRKEHIRSYLENARLDTNPVLIIYEDLKEVDALIDQITAGGPDLTFTQNETEYAAWQVSDLEKMRLVSRYLKGVERTYIADGHHRAAAAVASGLDAFSSVYMSSSQIKIRAFHRLVKDMNGHSLDSFLLLVRRNFHINQVLSWQSGLPGFAMYLKGMWFSLIPKDHILNKKNKVSEFSVYQLNQFILEPILRPDMKAVHRVSFEAGISADEMEKLIDSGTFEIGFRLNAISVDDLMIVADAGQVMPPKSTFILPKFPAGIIVRKIED